MDVPRDNGNVKCAGLSKQEKKRLKKEEKEKERQELEKHNQIIIAVRRGRLITRSNKKMVLLSQAQKAEMVEVFHYPEEVQEEIMCSINRDEEMCVAEILAKYSNQRSAESQDPEFTEFLMNPQSHVGTEIVGNSGNLITFSISFGYLSYQLQPQLKDCWKIQRCTFTVTSDNFVKQIGYHCSCFGDPNMCICRICAVKCHIGNNHKLTQVDNTKLMFCDCGAGEQTPYITQCNCCTDM
jgi:hypothetical protein